MRFAPAMLVLSLAATPAFAASHQPARPSAADAARMAQEPLVQDAAAAMIDRLADIVLDTRVGPAAVLTDPRDDVRASDTLRDLKLRDDPRFEERLHRDTRRAVGTAAAVAGGVAVESAELKRTAARLQEAVAPLMQALTPPEDRRDGN